MMQESIQKSLQGSMQGSKQESKQESMQESTQESTSTSTFTSTSTISITEKAANRVQQLIQEKQNDALKLRLYIIGGGCSGFQYGFSFGENINEDDERIERISANKKVTLLVDSLSAQYLENATVDYVENLQGAKFVVLNPNADTTCGCGSSFSIKEEK